MIPCKPTRYSVRCLSAIALVAAVWFPMRGGAAEPPQTVPSAASHALRYDSYGDPLPKDALLRLGTGRLHVDGQLEDFVFSPKQPLLAASDIHGKVRLWDTATGREIRTFVTGLGPLGLAFSPDGSWLVGMSLSGNGCIWNVATGELCRKIMHYRAQTRRAAVQFLSDGASFLHEMAGVERNGNRGSEIVLTDRSSGEIIRQVVNCEEIISTVAFSRDATRLAFSGFRYEGTATFEMEQTCRTRFQLMEVASGRVIFDRSEKHDGVCVRPTA